MELASTTKYCRIRASALGFFIGAIGASASTILRRRAHLCLSTYVNGIISINFLDMYDKCYVLGRSMRERERERERENLLETFQ